MLSCSCSKVTKPVVLGGLRGGADHQCGPNRGGCSVPVFTSASPVVDCSKPDRTETIAAFVQIRNADRTELI